MKKSYAICCLAITTIASYFLMASSMCSFVHSQVKVRLAGFISQRSVSTSDLKAQRFCKLENLRVTFSFMEVVAVHLKDDRFKELFY